MPIFRSDPCGIVCVILTYVALFYSDYVVINWIVLQTMQGSLWAPCHVVVFNTLIFLAIMAHVRAVFSDPGIVPLPRSRIDFSDMHAGKIEAEDGGEWSVCARCEMYRPPRAHHCRVCQRCIRRMDHHCPWINNCVGEWNQKYFLQFLVFVGMLCLYSLFLIATSWIHPCSSGHCKPPPMMIKQARLMHSVILSMESILFGLFVSAILCDQLQAIFSDETAVEQVKRQGPYRGHRPKLALMGEVCGKSHPLLWLLPCSSAPTSHSSISPHPPILPV
ncbi:palmitoyltransferase ZDHHC3 [Hyalella azteca]|uniref:Palmitoyltransferase n=2 Tax=Hyalella azteca TaxID=294128 RepID=A0A8B7PPT8_HYAAZ|nr:palmitoyltransferase ZDHHC3 [Hyalella azteca]